MIKTDKVLRYNLCVDTKAGSTTVRITNGKFFSIEDAIECVSEIKSKLMAIRDNIELDRK